MNTRAALLPPSLVPIACDTPLEEGAPRANGGQLEVAFLGRDGLAYVVDSSCP